MNFLSIQNKISELNVFAREERRMRPSVPMQFRISEIEKAEEEGHDEAPSGRRDGIQEVDERERNGECARSLAWN